MIELVFFCGVYLPRWWSLMTHKQSNWLSSSITLNTALNLWARFFAAALIYTGFEALWRNSRESVSQWPTHSPTESRFLDVLMLSFIPDTRVSEDMDGMIRLLTSSPSSWLVLRLPHCLLLSLCKYLYKTCTMHHASLRLPTCRLCFFALNEINLQNKVYLPA